MKVSTVGCVVLATVVACGLACGTMGKAVYPTVMPYPSSFSQTAGGAVVLVTNPGALPVHVSLPKGSTGTMSAGTQELAQECASRGLLAVMSGVEDSTLPWLKVRLPPLRNHSNPAVEFPAASGFVSEVVVEVDDLSPVSAGELWGMDESYTVNVDKPKNTGDGVKLTVTAKTFVGVCHAFQTVSQLIVWDGSTFVMPNLPLSVTDVPRFRWRGLLLDTARHYFPVDTIKHVLDGLAMHRMNVLHWHIVDAQSFPFQSTTYPELSAKGAFHPNLVYTHANVKDIVQYAFARGIRIVPEFDLPGHDASWGFGYPWLTTPCWDYVSRVDHGNLELAINVVSLDPTLDETITFVDGLIAEVASVFPDPFLHLGGDEVQPSCWHSDPAVVAFMAAHNLTSAAELQAWFTRKLFPVVAKHHRRPVFWEEAFESGATANQTEAVVNVWTSLQDLPAIHAAGQDALISYGAYLDRQNPANGTHWMFFDTWHDMYSKMITPDVSATSVLGGEASSWSENCDAASVDERVFHRLPAVAERLWSPASVNDIWDATDRMSEFRCKVLRRGIEAGPTQPAYCDVAQVASPQVPQQSCSETGEIVMAALLGLMMVVAFAFMLYAFRLHKRVRSMQAMDDSARLLPGDSKPVAAASAVPGGADTL